MSGLSSSAPAESGKVEAVDELVQFARYARQKIDRFLIASQALTAAKDNGNNAEVIRKLESADRHAAFILKCAVDLLHESLNSIPESQ